MKDTARRLALAAGLLAADARADLLVGLTNQNSLVTFDSAAPNAVGAAVGITGLINGVTITAIDRRPNGGALYNLGTNNSLYTIDAATGVATFASTLATAPASGPLGFDFNPVADRLRVVDSAGGSLRINVDTGATIAHSPVAYGSGDPNFGARPSIVGSAYTNNFATPATTALYDIDSTLNILALQNPPNAGTLATVGGLGVDVGTDVGFDISGTGGTAFLSDGASARARGSTQSTSPPVPPRSWAPSAPPAWSCWTSPPRSAPPASPRRPAG